VRVGDLVRMKSTLRDRTGDVILLLESHGIKKYYNLCPKKRPGFLFSGLCIRTQKAGYFVFEHDAEVVSESR